MKLTIEQMREIVNSAPEWATGYAVKQKEYTLYNFYCRDLRLIDLSTAIADHDRIDTCSDIRNHISPNTKVIEHE